ncbi:hypothetical protein SAMN05428975_0859 [Mucilaginibacter sp. OK268]|nr:hypothetical protein SAMN05428975_0859 [Mucilaginibacter sp. OK268]
MHHMRLMPENHPQKKDRVIDGLLIVNIYWGYKCLFVWIDEPKFKRFKSIKIFFQRPPMDN